MITMEKKIENSDLLKVTYKMLSEGRRYFGSAGVSLYNQLHDPKYKDMKINQKAVNMGIKGEKETSKIIREWMTDKKGVVLIDSISLPLGKLEPEEDDNGQLDLGDTDHLLILPSSPGRPTDVIVIDSKNWKAKTTYKVKDDGSVLRGNKHFKGSRPRARQMKYIWEDYYKDMNIKTDMFIVIPSEEPTIIRNRDWWRSGFKLLNQKDLITFLDMAYAEIPEEDRENVRIELVVKALMGLNKKYDGFTEKFGNIFA